MRCSLAWIPGISLTCQIQLMMQSLESLAGDKILLTLRGHTCVMGQQNQVHSLLVPLRPKIKYEGSARLLPWQLLRVPFLIHQCQLKPQHSHSHRENSWQMLLQVFKQWASTQVRSVVQTPNYSHSDVCRLLVLSSATQIIFCKTWFLLHSGSHPGQLMDCSPFAFFLDSQSLQLTSGQLAQPPVKSTLGPFLLHSNSLEHSEKFQTIHSHCGNAWFPQSRSGSLCYNFQRKI